MAAFTAAHPLDPTRFPQGRRTLTALMAHALNLSETALIATPDHPLTQDQWDQFAAWVTALNQGKPLAYLYGTQPFLEWDFMVDERVLIPRPETEALCDLTRDLLRDRPPTRILDLCCGSGAMGCALALSFPGAHLTLTDLCQDALAVARTNVEQLGLAHRTRVLQGDLWAAVPTDDTFDLVLANPPYVALDDPLDSSVRDYEPHLALFSEDGGQDHIKRIVSQLEGRLTAGGLAAFELGHHHAQTLPAWLERTFPTLHIEWGRDPFDVPRYLFCRPGPPGDGAFMD